MSTPFSHFFTKINQISPLEDNFTEVLNTIVLKPKILYFYGKMPKNVIKNGKSERPKTVAIVGSRHNTRYGEEIAYKLAYELAKNGIIVISGLAYGIDSIAHKGAVDAGGNVTALKKGTAVITAKVGKKKTAVTLKLKKKTTYYIRVRYVGKDGVSKWSKMKKVKTKK